jgi:hypothetical protein
VLSSNGTVAYWSNTLTITANALVLSAGSNTAAALKFTSGNTLYVANAGVIEYTGTAFYATPVGQQRGVIPGQQMFTLSTPFAGQNAAVAQPFLGVGVTLASNTVYEWEALFPLSKTAGTTSHNFSLAYGGTSNNFYIAYHNIIKYNTTSFTTAPSTDSFQSFIQTLANTTILSALTSATASLVIYQKGSISVNNGGTFIPQYALSAIPGGAYTTQSGSYFSIYPIGTGSANISIGTWA